MTKKEAIDQGIDLIKGQFITPGTIVAHRSDPIAYAYDRTEGAEAVCLALDGSEKRFPAAEIFDVNKLSNVARHLLNVGFWKEGMENMVLTIK